jgi:hypothetical protein
MAVSDVGGRVAWRRSVRVKLFALVGLGVLVGVIASLVGLAGLTSVNSNVVTLDRRVAQPLMRSRDCGTPKATAVSTSRPTFRRCRPRTGQRSPKTWQHPISPWRRP